MKLKNIEIYQLSTELNKTLEQETRKFPAKVYFHIIKNMKTLNALVEAINESRQYIIQKYNIEFSPIGEIIASQEDQDLANNELIELGNEEQEVQISFIHLQDIEDLEFTIEQMNALMFMIEE